MKLNFQTKNLIILNYNIGSGGKFLSMCLALNEYVLPMHKLFLKNKIDKHWPESRSFRAYESWMKMSEKHGYHIEFSHGDEQYGFNLDDDRSSQIKKANERFIKLTNQKKYFFCLTNHYYAMPNYDHFVNARNIMIHNDESVRKMRNSFDPAQKFNSKIIDDYKNHILFDISSVFDSESFFLEIKKTFEWLELKVPAYDLLDKLRERFVNNLKIPLKKK